MSFTEYPMAVGSWDVSLSVDTPRTVLRDIDVRSIGFSQIIITPAHVDPAAMGDAGMLSVSRYTGVYRSSEDSGRRLSGPGAVAYLGDEDGKGDVMESTVSTTKGWLSQWWDALFGGTINSTGLTRGTMISPGGAYRGTFQYVNRRQALDTLCEAFPVEYRVNPNLTVDLQPIADLYGLTPRVVVLGPGSAVGGGREIGLVGVRGSTDLSMDLEDYTSKIVYLTGDSDSPTRTTAGGDSTIYERATGHPLVMDRLIEAFSEDGTTPASMAAAHLGRFDQPRIEWTITGSGTYDIGQDCPVGSPIYLYDPDSGLYDTWTPVPYRGTQIYPTATRLMGLSTPIRSGYGVYLRIPRLIADGGTRYVDLTPFVEWETGDQTLTLGAMPRPSR